MSARPEPPQEQHTARPGEPRWPMAIAVVTTGLLRAVLPHELRNGDAPWLFLVLVVVLTALLLLLSALARCSLSSSCRGAVGGSAIALFLVVHNLINSIRPCASLTPHLPNATLPCWPRWRTARTAGTA